jgi:hypothetical protein
MAPLVTEPVARLERASEIADAQLAVAEQFAWPVGCLAGALAYVGLHSWAWGVAAFVVGFLGSVLPVRRVADRAEDEYFKAAEIGPYAKPWRGDGQS